MLAMGAMVLSLSKNQFLAQYEPYVAGLKISPSSHRSFCIPIRQVRCCSQWLFSGLLSTVALNTEKSTHLKSNEIRELLSRPCGPSLMKLLARMTIIYKWLDCKNGSFVTISDLALKYCFNRYYYLLQRVHSILFLNTSFNLDIGVKFVSVILCEGY